MKTKALVVEEDDQNGTDAEDAIISLGHEPLRARNAQDAEILIAKYDIDYALVSLSLRPRRRGGEPKLEHSLNLIDRLQREKRRGKVPVIVTTELEALPTAWIRDIVDLGAAEFVTKPFSPTGRRLSKIISKVLGSGRLPFLIGASADGKMPFAGGDLVLYPDRAELCGVRIITDRGAGQCLLILSHLCKKDGRGRFVRQSSEELANAIDAPGGASTIAGCVKRIRDNITQRLKKEIGIECGREDVIQNNWQGYALREWIDVGEVGSAGDLQRIGGAIAQRTGQRVRQAAQYNAGQIGRKAGSKNGTTRTTAPLRAPRLAALGLTP